MKHYQKHQSGRTLLEQLAVLAIVAVLVITALAGFTYARNKVMANRILSDVSLAYMDASEQERAVGVYPILFAPESSLFIETERQETASGKQTDLVRVPGVRSSVCKIVHQMTQDSSFVLLDWSDEAQDYVEFTLCSDGDNTMVFAYGKDIGCTCPEHGTCYLSAGCVCDFGYDLSENGTCEEKVCPTVKEIEDITDEYCCVTVNGEWNGFCYCPEDYYFNGQACVPGQGFCVYAYEPPSGGDFYADCSYTYREPGGNGYYADCSYTYSETEGKVSINVHEGCPSDQYCILQWADTDCGNTLSNEGVPTIYGRCTPFSLRYDVCRQHDEEKMPTLVQTQGCPTGQYCILKWSDEDCGSTFQDAGAPTIYGRCTPYSLRYDVCRQYDEVQIPTMRARLMCDTNQYCRLNWSSDTCATLSDKGAHLIYGVCLAFNKESPMICPME